MFQGLRNLLLGGNFFGSNGTATKNGSSEGGRHSSRASKELAKSRLSFVLVQDRAGLTPDEMARFKKEMVAVIEKYFMIDEQGFDISYKRETDTTTLVINSPVIVRRQDSPTHQAGVSKEVGSKRQHTKAKSQGKSEEETSEPVASGTT